MLDRIMRSSPYPVTGPQCLRHTLGNETVLSRSASAVDDGEEVLSLLNHAQESSPSLSYFT